MDKEVRTNITKFYPVEGWVITVKDAKTYYSCDCDVLGWALEEGVLMPVFVLNGRIRTEETAKENSDSPLSVFNLRREKG